MYFTIYKTTCTANGKYYIGQHQTEDLEDGYLGSGKHIKRAIKKYGRESFTKEILFVLNSFEEMDAKEAELITKEVLDDPLCMNHAYGGNAGNFQKLNENGLNNSVGQCRKAGRALKCKLDTDPDFRRKYSLAVSKGCSSEKRREAAKLRNQRHPNFKGKTHSESSKLKISGSMKGKGSGSANSQSGTCWVFDGITTKKIKLEELPAHLSDGWQRGRGKVGIGTPCGLENRGTAR